MPRPTSLKPFLKAPGGGLELTQDEFAAGVTIGGIFDDTRNAFVINLPIYAQQRLNGEETRPYVYLYSELSSIALEQVVFHTPLSTSEAAFVVTRSE